MQPIIRTISQKKLVGIRLKMSFMNDRTVQLWQSFMPRRREILNGIGTDLYNVKVYEKVGYFSEFDAGAEFEKWACVEVADFGDLPEGMEELTVEEGLYAVFSHKGVSPHIFFQIYMEWLPNSPYQIDLRPHFDVLGAKFKNNSPDSEEEIWIPIGK
jgi:AraC family transcriptional regulator